MSRIAYIQRIGSTKLLTEILSHYFSRKVCNIDSSELIKLGYEVKVASEKTEGTALWKGGPCVVFFQKSTPFSIEKRQGLKFLFS